MMRLLLLSVLFTMGFTINAHAQSNDRVAFSGRLICQLDELGAANCATGDAFRRLLPPSDAPALTSISAGDVHVCGITQAGAAYCWGDNNFGQLNAPQDVQFISISSGINLSCGVTTDNRAVCWGLDTHGETQPPVDQRFSQLAPYASTSCGVQLDGRISCWGQFPNRADRLDQFTLSKVTVNSSDSICGVADQGGVRCNFSSLDIPGNMVDVAQSNVFLCGVSATGDIDCRTTLASAAWENHLAARIAEINSGPNVVALFSSVGGDNNFAAAQICYELETGELGCIVRENAPPPLLPGNPVAGLEPAQNVNAFVYSDTTIELVWESRFTTAGADIYRNGELLATTQNGTSYIDDTLMGGVQYEYSVVLFNFDGVRSDFSTPISVTTGQSSGGTTSGYTPVDRPFAPTGLTSVVYNQNEIELFWDRVTVITNNFSGYEIWRDHQFLAFTRGVSFYDNTVQPNTSYDYDVVAVSEDGRILGFNGVEVNTAN